MKEQIKRSIRNLAENVARHSVGKSSPISYHEPKIPQALKTQTQENKKQ